MIAGGGELPRAIAQSVTASGRAVHILAIKGSADEAWLSEFPHDWMTLGEWGKSVRLLAAAGAKDIVLVGRVDRPTLSEIKFDTKGLMILPSLVAAARKGAAQGRAGEVAALLTAALRCRVADLFGFVPQDEQVTA